MPMGMINCNVLKQKVYYSDTDAYGVVWHGAYLRWLEMGRVQWCEMAGHNLIELENQDIGLPVVNLNVRYKSSARLNDNLIIETSVSKFNGLSVTFHQTIKSEESLKTFIEADVEVVAISKASGKLYRRMPDILSEVFKKEVECLLPA